MRFASTLALVTASSVLVSAATTTKSTTKSSTKTSSTTKSTTKSTTTKKTTTTSKVSTTLKTSTTVVAPPPTTLSSSVVTTTAAPQTTTTPSSIVTTSTTAAPSTTGLPSGDVCYVTTYSGVAAAVAACTNITLDGIAVPGNATLNLAKLLPGTTVTFAGTTTFGFADANYDMITVSGTNIHITGAPGSIIDGNGQAWWDGLGSNGGRTKPNHFFVVSKVLGTSLIDNLHIQNWPVHCFYISGSSGLTITNLDLDNSAGDAPNTISNGLAAAHNSDGFDLSGNTNVVLSNTRVVNQDDCVAITSGNYNTVSGLYCSGGHGLSIGSVGGKSNNNVTNIIFENSEIIDSQNGARIKSNSGTTGYIANITYSNIYIEGATIYGVDIQQDYLNGGPTGEPTNGVTITGVTLNNVTGTATSDATNYYILCGAGSCSDFTFNDVHITGGGDPSSCNLQPVGDFVCAP